jgi:hypothetical protein
MGSLFKNVWIRSDVPHYDMDPPLNQPLLQGDTKETINQLPRSEQCEFRVQGMTCGACVEVRKSLPNIPLEFDSKSVGYRRHAERPERHSLYQSGFAG